MHFTASGSTRPVLFWATQGFRQGGLARHTAIGVFALSANAPRIAEKKGASGGIRYALLVFYLRCKTIVAGGLTGSGFVLILGGVADRLFGFGFNIIFGLFALNVVTLQDGNKKAVGMVRMRR